MFVVWQMEQPLFEIHLFFSCYNILLMYKYCIFVDRSYEKSVIYWK